MKKLITICMTLALVLALAPAAFADVDLSGMTFDELVALKDQINLAIWSSQEWQEVEVPQGVWRVGEDIPAGKWTLRCNTDYYTDVDVGQKLNEAGTGIAYPTKAAEMVYNPNYHLYKDGKITEWTIDLAAGDYVVIDSAPAVFTPYAGKPSLGFK